MSNKFFKKFRKESREIMEKKLATDFMLLATMVMTRPKYIPKRLWFILYMPLFKNKSWKYIYKYLK